jgi:hypothetical protein
MIKNKVDPDIDLRTKFPPSKPCSCKTCLSYCKRPGWWTIKEAATAINAGFAERMMLELSPKHDFAVLAPAFKGNEGNYALRVFAGNGCTFLKVNLCELPGLDFQPLECRFCHHKRKGLGIQCHDLILQQWNSAEGKRLIVKWGNIIGFWHRHGIVMI